MSSLFDVLQRSNCPPNELTSSQSEDSDHSFSHSHLLEAFLEEQSRDDAITLLVELVGATNVVDTSYSVLGELRPYCTVSFGGRRIHKSRRASGESPIWTIDEFSLFLCEGTPMQLLQSELTVEIWSHPNKLQKKHFLGYANVPGLVDHALSQKRFEVDLMDEVDHATGAKLALRMRLASPLDIQFVKTFPKDPLQAARMLANDIIPGDQWSLLQKQGSFLVTEENETGVAGATFMNVLTKAFSSSKITQKGIEKVRVKPHPDPKSEKNTTYLSANEIAVMTEQPSHQWIPAGNGKLGNLYLEILSCHDLPNVDVGEAVGNVTDSFICAVFEDAVVQTPVIDDELSPHWLPWTQRAFRFGILHPGSLLYLAVFDYDLGPLDHEPIGRVAIPLGNFQNNTEYTLCYDLHKSANVNDRTSQGQVRIRLRVELPDEKKALLEALKPRPVIHVNTKRPKTFKCVRYACFGEFDGEDKFDLTVVRSYISEIFEYKRDLGYYITDSFKSLMFWRGQVQVFKGIWIPLHSFLFWLVGTTLVERPYLFPPFLILGVSWVMIANARERRQQPSPWRRCHTFWHYLDILKNGFSVPSFTKIEANEGCAKQKAADDAWKKRVEDDLKAQERRSEMEKQLMDAGNDAIHTQVTASPIPLDLLERLGRWQGYIGRVCKFFRWVKIIATWEEPVVAFWFSCVFFVSGLVSLLLPWAFILTWTGRIIMWGLFGPHMMVVDLFLQANSKDRFETLVKKFHERYQAARIRREEAIKLKSIKCLRFGQYITHVPAFNLARHHDTPLPRSTARLFKKNPSIRFGSTRIAGQQLYGSMIPRASPELPHEVQQKLTGVEARLMAAKAANSVGGGLNSAQQDLILSNSIACSRNDNDAVGYELVVEWEELSKMIKQQQHKTPAMPSWPGMNLCVVPYQEARAPSDPAQSIMSSITMSHDFLLSRSTLASMSQDESLDKDDDGGSGGDRSVAQDPVSLIRVTYSLDGEGIECEERYYEGTGEEEEGIEVVLNEERSDERSEISTNVEREAEAEGEKFMERLQTPDVIGIGASCEPVNRWDA